MFSKPLTIPRNDIQLKAGKRYISSAAIKPEADVRKNARHSYTEMNSSSDPVQKASDGSEMHAIMKEAREIGGDISRYKDS